MSVLGDLLVLVGLTLFGIFTLGLVALCHRLRES
jgi:thiol:disulfide interchange protein